MIQAFGLTSNPRKDLPPAVDDISFEARAGQVTALLGSAGAGKTTALRLMLELQQGRGITYFRGRPLHRISHPSREVGVLLGGVPGHPARTVRGHLRMLCAAAGVAVRRADEVLEVVGLVSLRDERLGTLSRGMDRRLGLACVLLSDPHTLVLDEPADGLSARETRWLHGMLRAHAAQGGTVLITAADPKEVARSADRVVSLDQGRVVADQPAADFARTRLRPRVAVRSPHAARLAALLAKEARAAHRSVEVVREGGNRLSVYGGTCADVGETAFRHGILVHQLADEIGDMGPGAGAEPDDAETPEETPGTEPSRGAVDARGTGTERERSAPDGPPERPVANREASSTDGTAAAGRPESASAARTAVSASRAPRTLDALPSLPPPISVRSAPSPLRPLRYEIRRAAGISTGFLIAAAVLVVSAVTAVLLARIGHTPQARLLAAWPQQVPLPPAALGAGLIGALAFGDEFRHPALAADRGTVPRRLGLLVAKLVVTAATAVALAFLTVGCDAELLYLVYGRELTQVPADWFSSSASWLGLVIGCAWAGVLAAGIFRSTTAGLAAVVAVPVIVVPLVHKALEGPSARTAAGFPLRVREVLLMQWPFGGERYLVAVARVLAQPVGSALALSVTVLLCAYLFTTLRARVR
ncbi:ATP-binding cassette domain-containing protein [Streptomyces griseoviridis]|uniref:ABC transporter ATP-binding protein n=1 Tax=Streptomyces TaxID=1883 RepID=UPI002474079F|nr:ATP-binding cassette domain-containing protein [Streptomyces sp. MAA16]MDH6701192.1 ABC-type multidrug transport system ATPase subunit [Streptomyces sp. MAA16]